jgi:hypothetical protein
MTNVSTETPEPMTTTQKLWLPIKELNEAHERTVRQMVQAYAEKNDNLLARALARKERIEQRLGAAYLKARQHLVEKMAHKVQS